MRSLKAVIFDFDGTLADSVWIWAKARSEAMLELGLDLPNDVGKLNEIMSKSDVGTLEGLGAPEKIGEFRNLYFPILDGLIGECSLEEGAMETLSSCKKEGLKVALVSFAYRWYVEKVLDTFSLRDFFDVVLAFEDVERPKPDPQSVLIVAEKLKVKPEEIAVVGDSASDIRMGKSAGAFVILYNHGGHDRFHDKGFLLKAGPDKVAKNMRQVLSIISSE
jgi:HAD superfamily hydrolase (TIGR01509 family)